MTSIVYYYLFEDALKVRTKLWLMYTQQKFTLSNQTILLNEPRSFVKSTKIESNQLKYLFSSTKPSFVA